MEEKILERLAKAEATLRDNGVFKALHPPPGPYAIFHHLGFAQERVGDIRFIFERMLAERREYSDLLRQELQYRPLDHVAPTRTPAQDEELREIVRRQIHLMRSLRLDFESLYTFGAIFLDQWSISAAYLGGLSNPEEMTFFQLAKQVESRVDLPHALQGVAASFVAEIRWLQLQLRTFRNRFVEHVDRPWQRGTSADLHGMNFTLHLPSPPGWLNDDEVDSEIQTLLRVAPKWLQEAPDTYWEKARPRALLERLVEHIGDVHSQADRDQIAKLVGKAGVMTPTFQVLAGRIAEFAVGATEALLQTALERPAEIQLGMPWKNNIDSFNERMVAALAKQPPAQDAVDAAQQGVED